MGQKHYFSPELFKFLRELRKNNNRDWFLANKMRYESEVRDPFLLLIADLAPLLLSISPHLVADPRPSGGSLFRIYRDIRFSKDKSPYKTVTAAHFPHRAGAKKDVNAPGFYLHLEPGQCFAGAGLWHPDSATLTKVHTAIVERPQAWEAVRRRRIEIEGAALMRPPKGYDPKHRFIEDLKRKDFVSSVPLSDRQVCSSSFLSDFVAACRRMSPLVEFLSRAVGLPW